MILFEYFLCRTAYVDRPTDGVLLIYLNFASGDKCEVLNNRLNIAIRFGAIEACICIRNLKSGFIILIYPSNKQ